MRVVVLCVPALCLLAMSPRLPNAPSHPQVFVSKEVQDSSVVYHYRVVNGSPVPMAGLAIGYDPDSARLQLNFAPSGWDFDADHPHTAYGAPPGWAFEVIPSEEDSVGMIEWTSKDSTGFIGPGQSASQFAVKVPSVDPPYEHGSWTLFPALGDVAHFTGILQPDNRRRRRR
jgi:hypothetical protein